MSLMRGGCAAEETDNDHKVVTGGGDCRDGGEREGGEGCGGREGPNMVEGVTASGGSGSG